MFGSRRYLHWYVYFNIYIWIVQQNLPSSYVCRNTKLHNIILFYHKLLKGTGNRKNQLIYCFPSCHNKTAVKSSWHRQCPRGLSYSSRFWLALSYWWQRQRAARFMRTVESKVQTEVMKIKQRKVSRYQMRLKKHSHCNIDITALFPISLQPHPTLTDNVFFLTDKRPFFVGSRYGRSQSDLTNMDENGKTSNMARIVPRNDRFFFGSRYGKRSTPEAAIDFDQNQPLTCFYTGVTNIFRCVE